uniref:Uncharacterized protein n=1 Tax=Lactuca sativa TaxID=4236 RepID=A0A9R1WUQ4_LACSA|nr:hypothetical protein LSAT_V11C900489220 [Lactuca sativa]
MFEDKVSLLRYALQRAFQAAPNRLMTNNAYLALLGVSLNASTTDEGLNFYDSQHRFEHSQLLLVLLSSLPHAPKTFQCRDLLILACSHAVSIYTLVPGEYPYILILISHLLYIYIYNLINFSIFLQLYLVDWIQEKNSL